MVKKEEIFPIAKQCELLSISRSFYYYVPVELSNTDLVILEKIDILYTDDPTRGQRRLRYALKKEYKISVGREAIRGYMQILGIAAIYPKKNLSKPDKTHKKYPYLLRGVQITRVNQVWSTDITYIRLKRGFIYLTAVIDWYSRYVLSWRISTTLERHFCIEAVTDAIEKYGYPEIFNTDQGSQYTSDDFTGIFENSPTKLSMDGKGRALDNVFVERLWRTVKYDDVFIKDYSTVPECREGLDQFFERYNTRREHQSLDYNYPCEVYFKKIELPVAA